jgi:hypothetical protein
MALSIINARRRDVGRHLRLRRSGGDRERTWRGPFGLCPDRCRAALADQIERSRGTLESCGARDIGSSFVKGALLGLLAALVMLSASPSEAHWISTRSGPPPEKISIPSDAAGDAVFTSA